MNAILLHEKNLVLAKNFKRSEAELLSGLILSLRTNAFREVGYPNLFIYCTKGLGLSEANACYFSKVAKKSEEVPALAQAVQSGEISLSQARRVAAVITPETAPQWIEKAATLPQRELERAVTIANPKAVIRERIRPIAPTRSELRTGISVDLENRIERAREVVSQSKKRAVTLETTLEEITAFYLEHKDPVEKAKRVQAKKEIASKKLASVKLTKPSLGRSMPAAVRHAVNQRDHGKCQERLPNHQPCGSALWVEHHHIQPKSLGGSDIPANLITLCSQHHKMQHRPGLQPER